MRATAEKNPLQLVDGWQEPFLLPIARDQWPPQQVCIRLHRRCSIPNDLVISEQLVPVERVTRNWGLLIPPHFRRYATYVLAAAAQNEPPHKL